MKTKSTGKQIQSIANLLCGLGWFVCAVIAIASFSTGYLFMGIIVIPIGGYIVWATTRFLQGFGELIEDTTANRANTDRILFVLESQFKPNQSEPAASYTSTNWICQKCGTENTNDGQFCTECGQPVWDKKK